MKRKIDQELLRSFAAEAKSYLPEILRGIMDFRHDPNQVERLEDSHHYVHTIKGAAAMIGLMSLGELAVQLEEAFENIAAGRVLFSDQAVSTLSQVVTMIGAYLDRAVAGQADREAVLAEASQLLRRLSLATGEARSASETQAAAAESRAGEPPASPLDPELSAELLEIFLPEAEEHLRTISLALPALAGQPDNMELLQNIRRSAHSLKGSAGVVGFHEISRLAHRMEDFLDLLYDGELSLTPELLKLLYASTDALEDMTSGRSDQRALGSLYNSYEQLLGAHRAETATAAPRPAAALSVAERGDPATQSALVAMSQQRSQFVRVPIGQLDEVVKLVTELIITHASFEQNLTEFTHQLEELKSSATRLGRVSTKMEVEYEASALGRGLALAPPEALNGAANAPNAVDAMNASRPAASRVTAQTHGFDDLEFDRYTEFHLLLRSLTEVSNDVETLDRELSVVRDHFGAALTRQERLSSEVQDKVMRLRMVPLSTLSSRFMRTVRTVAGQSGKAVSLVLEGEETQLDMTVIEGMADPLQHFLRNAVDHGIETAPVRQARDKPPTGTVRLRAGYEGTQIVIQISDDGAGIDPERLRVAAINGGYISPHDAARVPVEDLLSLIFLPGFSTADQVSEISGRGIGLDVARVAIHRLKGSVKVDARPGDGATFTVRLPMTLAVMGSLMVKVSHETFAIPLAGVQQILKIGPDQIELIGKDQVVRVGETIYPLMSLARLLSLKRPEERAHDRRPVLLMNVEGRQAAIAVDETLSKREIVVKNMGNHLRQVHGVTGATLTGNGSVVLILNLAELVREAFRPRTRLVATPAKRATTVSRRTLTVLVVDDSISVRRVLSNLIESAGWKPVLAKDGLDAMEILPQLPAPPDVVLLDIEMPRMDGYELIGALRKQQAYEHTPIVILTSRAGQKHREKAFELGATDYVVKPYQDEALLGLIRQLAHQSTIRN